MIKTLLASGLLICGLTCVRSVGAGSTQSPLKFRINKKAITRIINLRDQDVFKVFENVELNEGLENAQSITFSLQPSGVPEDFNLDIHMEKEYLGAETDKAAISGVATLKDGIEVPFTAAVPLIKLQYALGTKYSPDYKIDQLAFQQKEWTFKTGEVLGEGLSPELSQEIATAIENHVDDFKANFEKGSKKGEMEYIKDFPMDTVIPMAAIYYATNFAEIVDFSDTFAEFGFSLSHWKMLTEKQAKMLKEINQEFYNPKTEDGYEALLQVSFDDNLFNSFATIFTSVEKTFSVRDLMKQNPKTKPMISSMNTMILAPIFPAFAEKYGNNANIDLMMSPSHSLFLDGFPNSKMSGMYIDKNGNWKLQINLPMTIMVETPGKQWQEARSIYITAVFRFKVVVNQVEKSTKKFSITPKNLEISNLKVMENGQEVEMEQMMIQSVVNIQLENLKKEFKEFPFYLSDILAKNPKELQCLGFNIADLDVTFKKSQVQFSAYYKETKYQNKALCDQFLQDLRESPNKVFSQFMDNPDLMRGIKEAQKLSAGDKKANPFEAIVNSAKNIKKEVDKDVEHDEL